MSDRPRVPPSPLPTGGRPRVAPNRGRAVVVRTYPYAFHVAIDGNGLNGLEGRAGVCLFHYDPATGDHAYKITYFDGASGGHAPNVAPSRRVGFLGNTGQHLLFYDLDTLEEADRGSTPRFERPHTTNKGRTRPRLLPPG